MAGFSDYAEAALLSQLFRNTALATPATVYVSLHTADPTDAGTGTEVSGGSYARVSCTTGTSTTGVGSVFTAPAPQGTANRIANASAITFPAPTGNWGTVGWFAVWDAATTGNMLLYGALSVSRTINSGDSAPSFAIGALTVDLD
jgi:hypothetical protein